MKISDVLDQIGKDVLTEDSKKLLSEAFDEAVKTTVQEQVELEVKSSLQKLDEEHATKLEQLLQAIDEDHTQKLIKVLEGVDKDHTQKLNLVVSRYKRAITEDAKQFKADLTTQLSNYLDLYVSEKLPKEEIAEAVKNVQARRILEQVKQVVSLDEQFISQTVKEAVEDGKKTIESLRSELNEAVKSNIKLSQEYKSTAADLVLEKNTAGFSKSKKDYVLRVLKGKDPEFITENLNYVVKMFESDDDKKAQLVTEEAKSKSTVVTGKVDIPASQIKDASLVTEQTEEGTVSEYLNVLESQDNRFRK
jgi:hypothetical protein